MVKRKTPPTKDCDSYSISEDQIHRAVSALRGNKKELWADDSPLQLVFALQELTDISKRFRPKLIKVPHPLISKKASVCLIIKDRISAVLLSKLKSCLGKVITMRKLELNYREPERRAVLCGRFDLFVYDKRIDAGRLATLCGKPFLTKKKNPVSINVRSVGGVMSEIEQVKSSALYFKNGSATTSIKVAHLDFTDSQIVENVNAVLKEMSTIFDPLAVQSICIKAADSVSLPLFQCVRPSNPRPKPIITRPPAASVPIEAESAEFERQLDMALVNKHARREIFGL